MTLTPILPVAPAPASATDTEPSGGDGARFQRTLTEASGRYRADGAGRSGRARPADARIPGPKDRPADPGESGADASLPAGGNVANAADTGPATARGVDAALLVQTGAVTVAPAPGPPSVALPVQAATGEPGVVRQATGFSRRPSDALAAPGSPASPGSPAMPVTIPLAAATTFATVAAAPATGVTGVTAVTVATSTAGTAAAATMRVTPASPSASRDTALVPPAGPPAAATVDSPVGAASSPDPTATTADPVRGGTPAAATPDRPADAIPAAALAAAGGNAPVAGARTTRAASSVQAADGADSSAAPVTVDPAAGSGTVGPAHRPPDAGPAPDTPAGTAPDAASYPAAPAPGAVPATATAASPSAAASTPAPGEPVTVPDQVLRHLESVRALRDGGHRTVLRLEPDHLGAVTVTVDVRAGAVRMAVAGGPQALAAVREGIAHLRTVLADAGLDLGDVALRAEALQPTSGSSSGSAASPDGQASPNGSRPDRGSDGADGAAGGERRPARQHDQGGPAAADRLDAVRPTAALHSPPAAGAAGDEPATTRRLDVRV